MVVIVIHLLLKWSLVGVDIRSFTGGVDLVYNEDFLRQIFNPKEVLSSYSGLMVSETGVDWKTYFVSFGGRGS